MRRFSRFQRLQNVSVWDYIIQKVWELAVLPQQVCALRPKVQPRSAQPLATQTWYLSPLAWVEEQGQEQHQWWQRLLKSWEHSPLASSLYLLLLRAHADVELL